MTTMMNWKSEGESRQSRLPLCSDRPVYSEEFWRPEKTCCHSDADEKPPANAAVKKTSKRVR